MEPQWMMKPFEKILNTYLKKRGLIIQPINKKNTPASPGEFKQKAYHNKDLPQKDAYKTQQKILSHTDVKTIFDIGANKGFVTRIYRDLFPHASIYCFEPFAVPFEILRKKFEGCDPVKPFPIAISDKNGEKDLYLYTNDVTNSLYPTVPNVEKYVDPAVIGNVGKAKVPTETIDDFCRRHAINKIDILKMDIQGGELDALKGSLEMLSKQLISLVYTETWFVNVYHHQPLFHQLYQFLDDHGYELFDFFNFVYTWEGQVKWCDAIFLNKETMADYTLNHAPAIERTT